MFDSFADGTRSAIEMAAVANASSTREGEVPDREGNSTVWGV